MKEVTVSNWDDLDYANGKRVEAARLPSLVLTLASRTVELDLTQEHRDELEQMLTPYFEAGRAPERKTSGAAGESKHRGPYKRHPRAYYEGLRAWAAEHDIKITVSKEGKHDYTKSLQERYDAHLASQASP